MLLTLNVLSYLSSKKWEEVGRDLRVGVGGEGGIEVDHGPEVDGNTVEKGIHQTVDQTQALL